jgi:hypothetical protein
MALRDEHLIRGTGEAGRALRLVPSAAPETEPVWFCGKCAAPAPYGLVPARDARVCRSCGFGLLLQAQANDRPGSGEAFIVVDSTLTIQAMSERAERLLSLDEPDVVHLPVGELLTPTDADGEGQQLIDAVIESISGSESPRVVTVHPLNKFGAAIRARVVPCGPPRAALIVLEHQPAPRALTPVGAA